MYMHVQSKAIEKSKTSHKECVGNINYVMLRVYLVKQKMKLELHDWFPHDFTTSFQIGMLRATKIGPILRSDLKKTKFSIR